MRQTIAVVKDGIRKIRFVFNRKQKLYGVLLIVLSLFGAVFETVGVGIVMPIVQVMVDTEKFMHNRWIVKVNSFLHISDVTHMICFLLLVVIIIFILKNLFFMLLSWIRVKYSCKIQRELSYSMMKNVMHRPYLYFTQTNTAEIIRDVSTDTINTSELIYQLLRMLADVFIIVLIGIYILITDWIMASGVAIMAFFCLCFIYFFFQPLMRKAGEDYNTYSARGIQYLMQSIQGIKEVIVLNRQQYFLEKYHDTIIISQRGKVQQTIGLEYPAYIIEASCITGLLTTVCIRVFIGGDSVTSLIPVLSAFAIGAFRILPSLGRISAAMNGVIFYTPSLNHVYSNYKIADDQNQRQRMLQSKNDTKIRLVTDIKIQEVVWRYNDNQSNILDQINITIEKGQSIAFIGQSGAGKTTLADIVLGLLNPIQGSVLIDNYDVSSGEYDLSGLIGYVPQTSYLIDDSVRSNVAFGIDESEIDDDKVWYALEQAQLKEFISRMPEGINTTVGDRGVRFSGGQRQRVAIARALYNDPDILIFDEATAALDNETETAIMESVDALKGHKTIIIIAHRLTTVKNCDAIYEIKEGKAYLRKYEEL